ncbi:MAG: glycosyltransferase family 4 protein [Actinomycetota bacterium]|nr:glycosyltransferase family 4 protein [Actinomycetota bacterium]
MVKNKSVLMVAGTSMLAGGERNLLDLTTAALKNLYHVGLVAPGKGRLTDRVEARGCPVWDVAMPKIPNPVSILRIRKVLIKEGYDIVHAHGHLAGLYARLAALGLKGTRTVYTMNGIHYPNYANPLKKRAFILGEKLLRSFTDRYIVVCRNDLETGTRLGIIVPGRTAMIYNGIHLETDIDPSRVTRLRELYDRGGGVVLHVGRFNYQKAHYLLIKAIPEILESHPDVTFLLAGDGELLEGEKTRAAESGIPSTALRFLGHSNEVDTLMTACDFLVLPSLWEGFPYVILEAMRVGKPVVATDVGGVSEAVAHKENGLLVAPRDSEALAQAIVYLLDHPEEAVIMGRKGKESVSAFAIGPIAARTLELYQGLTAKSSDKTD